MFVCVCTCASVCVCMCMCMCVRVHVRVCEKDGGGWTDPQWWCQRAESGCLGCHNVSVSLRDITHINSLSHTHSRSLQDVPEERSERGVSSTPVLPKPSIKLTWSESNAGLGTPSASRQQYTLTHSHARPEQSMPAAHVHTGLRHTHAEVCTLVFIIGWSIKTSIRDSDVTYRWALHLNMQCYC